MKIDLKDVSLPWQVKGSNYAFVRLGPLGKLVVKECIRIRGEEPVFQMWVFGEELKIKASSGFKVASLGDGMRVAEASARAGIKEAYRIVMEEFPEPLD